MNPNNDETTKSKSPAFQFYPTEFLSDINVIVMTSEEIGMYWLLCCVCWIEGGIPDDMALLSGICRSSIEKFEKSWNERIKRCFQKGEDGRFIHPRLDKERKKQEEFKAKKAESGRVGASKRWSYSKTKGSPLAKSKAHKVLPMANDSSLSLSPSLSLNIYKKRLNLLFKRRDSTEWSSKEQKVLGELAKRPEFEFELSEIEKRYTSGAPYLRQDIQTLLNNWSGELDRARNQSNGQPQKPPVQKIPSVDDHLNAMKSKEAV